ncbi:hypothetical protein HOK51_03885 [Candidatus Woesearchaeota archaeon]|jgi:hypothetical protein|nr:hypothetical protein [Candidatus Woesearchaeota archaeon]MBT6518963.1 hypothetical protein [Candidatus Woesearchaeota archaeon]MBT7368328.1 hypothetical protein [Candidatus Woesearchaeota archaeon]
MDKIIRIKLSPEAEEVYRYLNSKQAVSKLDKNMLRAINQKISLIKCNPHFGNPVAKHLIPSEYKIKYYIKNLFRVELPSYWRMLYTVVDGETEIEIIAFVLDIIDHNIYNKKFGYKKR